MLGSVHGAWGDVTRVWQHCPTDTVGSSIGFIFKWRHSQQGALGRCTVKNNLQNTGQAQFSQSQADYVEMKLFSLVFRNRLYPSFLALAGRESPQTGKGYDRRAMDRSKSLLQVIQPHPRGQVAACISHYLFFLS